MCIMKLVGRTLNLSSAHQWATKYCVRPEGKNKAKDKNATRRPTSRSSNEQRCGMGANAYQCQPQRASSPLLGRLYTYVVRGNKFSVLTTTPTLPRPSSVA